jgi:transcription elongation GreA/GreB family factor
MDKNPTKIDILREKLKKLQNERTRVQNEKGQAAEHNKDIRENADYDYWLDREISLSVRIRSLSAEIEELYKKAKK